MAAITLRGLTDELAGALRQRAQAQHKSVSRYLVGLIEQDLLGAAADPVHGGMDLDDLLGPMAAADPARSAQATKATRRVDPERWP